MSTIRICSRHDKKVPLIYTFKFMGAEFWCPACGANYGILGAGDIVKSTKALEKSAIKWREKALPYLRNETDEWDYTIKD